MDRSGSELRLALRLAPPEPGSGEPGPHLLLESLFILVHLVLRELPKKLLQARAIHAVAPQIDTTGPVRVQHHDIVALVYDKGVAADVVGVIIVVLVVPQQTMSSLARGFKDQSLGDLVDG